MLRFQWIVNLVCYCSCSFLCSIYFILQLNERSSWKRKPEKNPGLNGIRTLITSVIPVQCSYQLSRQAKWGLVMLWARNIPVKMKTWKWICLKWMQLKQFHKESLNKVVCFILCYEFCITYMYCTNYMLLFFLNLRCVGPGLVTRR